MVRLASFLVSVSARTSEKLLQPDLQRKQLLKAPRDPAIWPLRATVQVPQLAQGGVPIHVTFGKGQSRRLHALGEFTKVASDPVVDQVREVSLAAARQDRCG